MSRADRQINEAVSRFESFHGFSPGPKEVGAIVQNGPAAGLRVGKVDEVTYTPIGEKTRFRHRFAKGARPALAVSHNGRQSYMVGGAYEFTGRGFVDRPGKGNQDMTGGELIVINPLDQPRGKRAVSKRKRMSALQAKYFGGGKRKRHRHSRALRAKRNPRSYSRARAALSSRTGLGGLSTGGIMGMVEPVGVGAIGAFGIDMLWTQFGASLPATLQSGVPMGLAKIAASIGVGMAVGMVAGRRYGNLVAMGGATVAAFNMVTELAGGMTGAVAAPNTGNAALNRYIAARRNLSRYVPARGMGYTNAGRVAV